MASSRSASRVPYRAPKGVFRPVTSITKAGKEPFKTLQRRPAHRDAPARAPLGDRSGHVGWNLETLSGRFVEISSWGQTSAMTAAASLVHEAQLCGEPAAWVFADDSTFFPPDLAESGIDLNALAVIRVPHAVSAVRAADTLLRSGGFGVLVLDLSNDVQMRMAVQVRLAALAKKYRTTLVCLTRKEPAVPSLGPLVSLRVQGIIRKTGFNRFIWELQILRDKRHGLGWTHSEVCRGPDGLC